MKLFHTPQCIVDQQAADRFRAVLATEQTAWLARWPHACPRCLGQGVEEGYDSDAGAAWSVTCTYCIDWDICPRCGKKHTTQWTPANRRQRCTACDWNWGRGADDRYPPDQEANILNTCLCEPDSYYDQPDDPHLIIWWDEWLESKYAEWDRGMRDD